MTTKSELVELEQEREQLRSSVQSGRTRADGATDILTDTFGRFKPALADLTSVTQHQLDKSRGILRDLMGQHIVLHLTADGKQRFLTAEVSGDYAGLYRLVTGKKNFGGGEGNPPSLTALLHFKIEGVALAA
jgi:hypothetical protein